jgi:hypothetical protein
LCVAFKPVGDVLGAVLAIEKPKKIWYTVTTGLSVNDGKTLSIMEGRLFIADT